MMLDPQRPRRARRLLSMPRLRMAHVALIVGVLVSLYVVYHMRTLNSTGAWRIGRTPMLRRDHHGASLRTDQPSQKRAADGPDFPPVAMPAVPQGEEPPFASDPPTQFVDSDTENRQKARPSEIDREADDKQDMAADSDLDWEQDSGEKTEQGQQRITEFLQADGDDEKDGESDPQLARLKPPALPAHLERVFEKYVTLHRQMVAGTKAPKWVHVQPTAQMCNRLRLLVTGLVLGMLTDRAVLVSFTADHYADVVDLFDCPLEIEGHTPAGRSVVLSLGQAMCEDLPSWKEDTIVVSGVSYLVPAFYTNPHLHDRFLSLFGEQYHGLFGHVMRYFLKPSEIVQSEVDSFWQRHLAGSFVVGVHYRRKARGDLLDFSQFLSCAQALVPTQHRATAKFFVAADDQEGRVRAREAFLNASYDASRVVFYKDFALSSNANAVRFALTELLLVSSAHELVLSSRSFCSETSAALSGRPSTYAVLTGSKARQHSYPYKSSSVVMPGCLKPRTSEPSAMDLIEHMESAQCSGQIDQYWVRTVTE